MADLSDWEPVKPEQNANLADWEPVAPEATPAAAPAQVGGAISNVPDKIRQPEPEPALKPHQLGFARQLMQLVGAGETGLSAITGAVAPTVQALQGEANKFGEIKDSAAYQPSSEEGKRYTESLSSFLNKYPELQAIPGIQGMVTQLGHLAGPAASQLTKGIAGAAKSTPEAIAGAVRKVAGLPEETGLPPTGAGAGRGKTGQSMGAAQTPLSVIRSERAKRLLDTTLTKGQEERDLAQMQFESETAKDPKLGKPLREQKMDAAENALRKFDSWVDETGASLPENELVSVGQVVDAALVTKVSQAKKAIRTAFSEAKNSPEAQLPVDTNSKVNINIDDEEVPHSLVSYLNSKVQGVESSKVTDSVRKMLVKFGLAEEDQTGNLVGKTGTVRQMEDFRKEVSGIAKHDDATGIRDETILKKIIDAQTEPVAGPLYKKARKMRADFAREFQDKAVISKLLRTKPGSADRAVAFENVHKHSILNAESTQQVQDIKDTLMGSGEEGQQAWKELQGATYYHLKNILAKGVQLDERSNRPINARAFDAEIQRLDRGGRLDVIFGKQKAEQIREVNQSIMDIFTTPEKTTQNSNTVSFLMRALDKIEGSSVVGGVDKALGLYTGIKPIKYMAGKVKDAQTAKRVEDALNQK